MERREFVSTVKTQRDCNLPSGVYVRYVNLMKLIRESNYIKSDHPDFQSFQNLSILIKDLSPRNTSESLLIDTVHLLFTNKNRDAVHTAVQWFRVSGQEYLAALAGPYFLCSLLGCSRFTYTLTSVDCYDIKVVASVNRRMNNYPSKAGFVYRDDRRSERGFLTVDQKPRKLSETKYHPVTDSFDVVRQKAETSTSTCKNEDESADTEFSNTTELATDSEVVS